MTQTITVVTTSPRVRTKNVNKPIRKPLSSPYNKFQITLIYYIYYFDEYFFLNIKHNFLLNCNNNEG